jgi:hypothetical protein
MNNYIKTETRQERREKKLRKKKECMSKHGKGFIETYRNAIFKRLRIKEDGKK